MGFKGENKLHIFNAKFIFMTRDKAQKIYNCSYHDAIIIAQIITVKQWNENNPLQQIKRKTGYVLPLYHGYHYSSKKAKLINQYTYINL
jgi:hypothetical protein